MATAGASRRNLFDVDVEAIERLLTEANAPLMQRCEQLIAALARMPAALESDDDVARAESYARQLKAAMSDLRKAKVTDRAPFARAEKTFDAFFARLRKPLDRTLSTVERALDAARARALRDVAIPLPEEPAITPIAVGGGDVVMTATEPPHPPNVPSAQAVAHLPTVWKASFIDRGALDLDALRELMTDTEMDRLVTRWLKEHGPKPLRGVTWVEVVKT